MKSGSPIDLGGPSIIRNPCFKTNCFFILMRAFKSDGKCVLVEGSAIRLSLIPWLLSLVLPLMMVVEKGGRVTGLVVLMDPFLLGCACTSLLDLVAQHTAFHDFDTFARSFLFMKSTAISVIVVPIATGTLF